MVELVAKPHLFKTDIYRATVPEGQSIAEILGGCWPHLHVCIDDAPIPREYWRHVRPKQGATLIISAVPQGGGGGKDVLRVVALIAVAIAAPYAAAALTGVTVATLTVGGQILAAGLTLSGSLLVNALIPPQIPSAAGGATADRFNRITGARNRLNPYGVLPKLYGRHRYFPPLAAMPYTAQAGDDQYLRMLLCLGYGPLSVGGATVGVGHSKITQATGITAGTIKIGDTPIEQYSDVSWEIGTISQMTLYTKDVAEENPAVGLDLQSTTGEKAWFTDNVSAIRTTAENTSIISIDITFSQGLWSANGQGRVNWAEPIVEFKIEYAVAGSGSWQTVATIQYRGPVQRPFTRSYPFSVPANQYDIRLTRVRTYIVDRNTIFSDAIWTALRSFKASSPWTRADTVLMALHIRATDQLNGVVDELSVDATSVLPVWNGTAWTDQVTSNPAWAYVDALKGPQVQNPLSDSRLSLTQIKDWADWCAANGITYNWVHDGAETVLDRIRAIASTGRASWAVQNSLFTVVRDEDVSTPVQMISPRNSWGFKAEKVFHDIPHAVKVRYIDTTTWQQAERIVYDDDYSAANATKFEVLETQGVIDKGQAWKEGRFHLAQLRLRPEVYSVDIDAENLISTRGDLVRLAHDVMLVGIKWGRVKAISGADITLDEEVTMEAGKSYVVRARLNDGTQSVQTLSTVEGTFNTITLDAAITGLTVGDLVLFGESGMESIEAKILNIDYHSDLSATLRLVDAAPAIHTADTGAIPSFDPGMTLPQDPTKIKPPAPTVLGVKSDESVLTTGDDGTLHPRIVVHFAVRGSVGVTAEVESRYKINGSDGSWSSGPKVLAGDGIVSINDVIEGQEYAVELRTKSPWNTYSTWVSILETVIGKSSKPADVDQFTVTRLADGTRQFQWVANSIPPDVRVGGGYRIKYAVGSTLDWATGIELHTNLLRSSPHETNQLAKGEYTFGIVQVDSVDNESVNPLKITATLGDPRLREVLIQRLDHDLGWPGTLSSGFIDVDNVLREASTWDSLPNTWDALADTWNTITGAGGVIYETEVMDIGSDADFVPLVSATGNGTRTLEMKVGSDTDGGVVGSYGAIAPVSKKRYIQIQATVSGTNPTLSTLTTLLDAEPVIDDFEDIATATESATWFERIAAGHFKVAARKAMSSLTFASIRAIQNVSVPHTWTLMSKDAVVTGNPNPAAEFKIYDNNGTLVDALIDVELKGPKTS